MKIVCSRKDLYESVGIVARVVASRSALPILSNILIVAGDNKIKLTSSDLELGMECIVEARVLEDGAVTAPARILNEVLGSLPDFDVTIDANDSNTLTINCGASEFSILGLPADEYPVLPQIDEATSFRIDKSVISQAIDKTAFAISRDDTRPVLTGMLMKIENGLVKLVSTDTHRLCLETITVPEFSGKLDAIIPGKALKEIPRLVGDDDGFIDITVSASQIKFDIDGKILTSRLIDGNFPNFERVVPADNGIKVIVPTDLFRQCVKRSAIVAADSLKRVVIEVSDNILTISAESSNIGRVHEELQIIHSGDNIKIAFNVDYLLDMITKVETDSIEIELSTDVRPAILRPQGQNDYTYVLMPMQLN